MTLFTWAYILEVFTNISRTVVMKSFEKFEIIFIIILMIEFERPIYLEESELN